MERVTRRRLGERRNERFDLEPPFIEHSVHEQRWRTIEVHRLRVGGAGLDFDTQIRSWRSGAHCAATMV